MSTNEPYPIEKLDNVKEHRAPTIKDVQLLVTSVYNKMPAPPKSVWFVCKIKVGNITYSKHVPVMRQGMPVDIEEAVKEKFKANFFKQLIVELNKSKVK